MDENWYEVSVWAQCYKNYQICFGVPKSDRPPKVIGVHPKLLHDQNIDFLFFHMWGFKALQFSGQNMTLSLEMRLEIPNIN